MKEWAIYSILASAAFGLSAFPLRVAVRRLDGTASPDLLIVFSCLGSVVGTAIHFVFSDKSALLTGVDRQATFFAMLSGLIGIAGSLAVIKALRMPLATVSNVMTVVNTNIFFVLLFDAALLRELPDNVGLIKLLCGAALIFAGSVFICR